MIRISKLGRVGHVANAESKDVHIFPNTPHILYRLAPLQTISCSCHDIGESFIQCSALKHVDKVGGKERHAVGEFMSD
jgi:hypothetical protein